MQPHEIAPLRFPVSCLFCVCGIMRLLCGSQKLSFTFLAISLTINGCISLALRDGDIIILDKKTLLRSCRTATLVLASIVSVLVIIFLVRFVASDTNSQQTRVHAPVEVIHRVLFLSSYNPLYFTYDSQVRGLEKGLYPKGIEYDVVYMDAKASDDTDTLYFYEFIKSRLQSQHDYEAVLLGDDAALLFAMGHQEELFKGLPMVFFGINDFELASRAAQNPFITGFYENTYLEQTIELALRLFPHAKKLVALHDQSTAGIADIAIFHSCSDKYGECAFIDLDTTTFSQIDLISLLEALPKDSLLLYMTCYTDKDGNNYSMLARTNSIVSHVHVPIFRNYVGSEGLGVLGGIAMDFEAQCVLAAGTVADVLSGADISDIPLSTAAPSRCSFDWQLLKHYGADTSLLPSDTVFYNKPESFMHHYGRILPPVVMIGLVLLLLFISSQITSAVASITSEELRVSRDTLAESQEMLRYQAEYDEELDILNRRTASEQLRTTLMQNQVYSIVIIDIDGFKELNESYGHQVADSILQYLVAVFKDMGRNDGWLLARYGGDEFLLMIPKEHLTATSPITEKILATVREPIPLGDETIAVTASMGISNSDGITVPDQHIMNAELAMYEAKSRGRNGAFLYGDEMKEKVRQENHIKAKLMEAFENDGFFMVYQPQIDAKTKKVNGYEALVRMKEPGIYPGQFIPVAERSGWIWRIGRITTELAIKQLAAWRDEGYELHPVSVNFSSNQLNDHGYIDFVQDVLDRYKVPAHFLEIEITEGLFLEKSALADEIFKRFKSMGIRLLMDDFGTGYSSLGYLTYIPVDVIKLDKSLVDTYLVDGKDSFIRNIIHLMHDLGKEMIIEGVEEKWQFERLQEFGADTIQGYYFSKPIPAADAIVFTVNE